MTIYYVVRHKPSGSLLPARVPATKWDFEIPDGVFEPRLFKSERAAKNCATCWAQGSWAQELVTESEGWEYPSYTYLATPVPHKVEGRLREHLEVLPVKLEMMICE
jgi:hypothetical protein